MIQKVSNEQVKQDKNIIRMILKYYANVNNFCNIIYIIKTLVIL